MSAIQRIFALTREQQDLYRSGGQRSYTPEERTRLAELRDLLQSAWSARRLELARGRTARRVRRAARR